MHAIIHVQTNTATIVIYDLMSLKHRLIDDVDWWSLPEDEVEEDVEFDNFALEGFHEEDLELDDFVNDEH